MKTALCLLAAALGLAAQPKLLVNAQADTRSAAAGLDQTFRPLLSSQQPAWIGYSVPSVRAGLGCDYVRDGWSQPGVIHLEPPDHAVILFRVEAGGLQRIRSLSPNCEIDAGGLPLHWLEGVKPDESVALLAGMADQRERYSDSAITALSLHAGPAADAALKRYLAPTQPAVIRSRAAGAFGNRRAVDTLRGVIENDPDSSVRRRAVSALQGMPDGEGIPLLIEIAKTTKDNEIRKQAMNSLGNSHDMRAITFFEAVLKK